MRDSHQARAYQPTSHHDAATSAGKRTLVDHTVRRRPAETTGLPSSSAGVTLPEGLRTRQAAASAYALGEDVQFGAGELEPETWEDAALDDALEVEAEPSADSSSADPAALVESAGAGLTQQSGGAGPGSAGASIHHQVPWGADVSKPNQEVELDISATGLVFPERWAPGQAPPGKENQTFSSSQFNGDSAQAKVPLGSAGRIRILVRLDSGPKGGKRMVAAAHDFSYDFRGDKLTLGDLGTITLAPPPPDGVHIDADWKPQLGPDTVSVNPNFVGPNQTSKQKTSSNAVTTGASGPSIPFVPSPMIEWQKAWGENSEVRQSSNAAVQQLFRLGLEPAQPSGEPVPPKQVEQRTDPATLKPFWVRFPSGVSALSSPQIVAISEWVDSLPPDIRSYLGMLEGGKLARRDLLVFAHGHASKAGPDSYNQNLASARAQTVQKYLIDRLGEGVVVRKQASGEQKVPEPEPDGSNKQGNRSVEIVIVRDPSAS